MFVSLERKREEGFPRKRQSIPRCRCPRVREHGVGGLRPPVEAHVFPTFYRQVAQGPPVFLTDRGSTPVRTRNRGVEGEEFAELAEYSGESTETRTNSSKIGPESLHSRRNERVNPPSPEEPLQLRSVDTQTSSETGGESECGSSTHREAELSTLAVEVSTPKGPAKSPSPGGFLIVIPRASNLASVRSMRNQSSAMARLDVSTIASTARSSTHTSPKTCSRGKGVPGSKRLCSARAPQARSCRRWAFCRAASAFLSPS